MSSRLRHDLGGMLLLWALYAGLTATLAWPELLAGLVAAVSGAATVAAAKRKAGLRFRADPRWIRPMLGIPAAVAADCTRLAVAAARALGGRVARGELGRLPLQCSDALDPLQATHRALLTAAISLAPNEYVVSMDLERREVVVHRLLPAIDRPRDQEWPI